MAYSKSNGKDGNVQLQDHKLQIHLENVDRFSRDKVSEIRNGLNVLEVDIIILIDSGINTFDEFKTMVMDHPKFNAIYNNLSTEEQRGIIVFTNK